MSFRAASARLKRSPCWLLMVAIVGVGALGCSNEPPRLVAPKLDAEAIIAEALKSYDLDANGELSSAELAASPGIKSSVGAYDLDGNNVVSESELRQRIGYLAKLNFALASLKARVVFNGKPLEGAEIEMVPEPHFGEMIKTAYGVTDHRGEAVMAVPAEDLPAAQQSLKGIHTGTYRVKVTHPDKQLPSKYNSETTLGYETRIGAPSVGFELRN